GLACKGGIAMNARAALLAAAVAACGDAGPSADQACADLARARCVLRDTCSNGARIERDFGTVEVCQQREKLACLNGVGAPSTGNSPTLVETCARAMPSESCSDFFLNNLPSACIVTGKLAASAPCAFNGQCTSTFCGVARNSACG